MAMTALLRQGLPQQLLTRLAARVFTTSSHLEAAAPAAASATKTALNKEFQIYRYHACSFVSCELHAPVFGLVITGVCHICRWDPDNGGKPSYRSYDVDINRYEGL